MRNRSFIIPLALVVASCSVDNSKDSARTISHQTTSIVTTQSAEATVKSFIMWYGQNREKLYTIPVVPASMDADDTDSTSTYRVDFMEAEKYLSVLRSSGFVSKAYLANDLTYMHRSDSTLQANPQFGGPPQGFNYDRVVFSQDPDADLEKLRRTKPVVTINGDTARAFFAQLPKPEDLREGADLEFLLVRQQGEWLIEKIRPVFAP